MNNKGYGNFYPVLLFARSIGERHRLVNCLNDIGEMELQRHLQVITPHKGAVTSIQLENIEERFLLSGSADSSISLHDLSRRGRSQVSRCNNISQTDPSSYHQEVTRFEPIAQSIRSTTAHTSSVVRAEWYPFDSGAFVSASTDGSVIVWDTDAFQPIARWRPFQSISAFHLSKSIGRSESMLAIGSNDDCTIRILDLRSGASSQTLTGHTRSVTSVQWCPTSDVVLASGSRDGTVRLWDIRRAGPRSNFIVLDHEQTSPLPLRPFQADYGHLRDQSKQYKASINASRLSHTGPVSGISFTSDGQRLVSINTNQLHLWDLRSRGNLVLRHFQRATQIPFLLIDHYVWISYDDFRIACFSLDLGGSPLQLLEGHLGSIKALECSKQHRMLISGGADGMILVWSQKRPTPYSF